MFWLIYPECLNGQDIPWVSRQGIKYGVDNLGLGWYRHGGDISMLLSAVTLLNPEKLQCLLIESSWNVMAHGDARDEAETGVGSQYPSRYLGTRCIQHYYRWCAHLGCQ